MMPCNCFLRTEVVLTFDLIDAIILYINIKYVDITII